MRSVFVVDDDLETAGPGELDRLTAAMTSPLPEAYARFLSTYGAGTYDDFLWVRAAADVLAERTRFRERLRRAAGYWWPASERVLPLALAVDGLPVAISDDGDELFLARHGDGLFVAPRHQNEVFSVPGGFDDPLNWPTTYRGSATRIATFMPSRNAAAVEMVAKGAVPSLAEQERVFSAILGGSSTNFIRDAGERHVITHFRHSRCRLQLAGRVRFRFNRTFPALVRQAVLAGEAMGFRLVDEAGS